MAGFLSLGQFNQWKTKNNKPTATYQGYKAWVTKTRAARVANAANPQAGTGALGDFTGAIAPGVRTQLQGDINAQIKAALAGVRSATSAEQAQANRQAEVAQKYAIALGNVTAPDAGQIKDSYLAAADRYRLLGQGLTGAVGEAQGRDVDAVRQNIEQQTGAAPAPGGTYDLNDLRNTALMTGVTIPGKELVSDAERAGTLAAYDRQAQVSQVGSIAQQYLQKSTDAQTQLAAKRAELEATRPSLWQKAVSDYQEQQRQQRALDVQVGTLRLSQAKTASEQAVAMSKITDTLWTVDKKGNLVDTGRPVTGTPGAIAAANQAAQTARANANRKTQVEIANIASDAKKYGADTSAQAAKDVAGINAAAKKAINDINRKKGKPATVAQRAAVIRGAGVSGGKILEDNRANIRSHIPNLGPRDKSETLEQYNKRYQLGVKTYRNRLLEHRQEIVNRVAAAITLQLQTLKMNANQIEQYADAIVAGSIPKAPGPDWLPPGLKGPVD